MSTKKLGLAAAIVAAIAYGLNPLFALPIFQEGVKVDSVIFYRFSFAAIILAVIMVCRRQSFGVTKAELLPLVSLGGLFAVASYTLFESFNYMDAGIACTILFVYPLIVAVIMALFFKERASVLTYLSIALSLIGIAMLYNGEGGQSLSTKGVAIVMISAITYALYIVVANKSRANKISPIKVTFYATAVTSLLVAVKLNFLAGLQPIPSLAAAMNITGLSFITTVLSMVLIAYAAKSIGSTYTSIMGCLEPLTALILGVLVFDEVVTPRIALGVILILISVSIVILKNSLGKHFHLARRVVAIHKG